jgi:hypothetical protein
MKVRRVFRQPAHHELGDGSAQRAIMCGRRVEGLATRGFDCGTHSTNVPSKFAAGRRAMKVESAKLPVRVALAAGLVGMFGLAIVPAEAAVHIEGQVQAGGGSVANSTVTLWAGGGGEPGN